MKIKRFKLFEKNSSSIYNDLVEQFDDDFIDEYYKKNNSYDFNEIWSNFPKFVIDQINDDEFVQDYINDQIENSEFEYCGGEYDLKEYIKSHFYDLQDAVEQVYRENHLNDDDENEIEEEDEDEEDELTIDEDILDEFSEDELREVISNSNKEKEYTEEYMNDMYRDNSAQDILEEFYNIDSLDRGSSKNLLNWISNYIDEKEIEEKFAEDEDSYYKKERIAENIYYSKELQQKLLDIDSKNAIAIFDLIEDQDDTDNNIGDQYDFQKAYMEEYIKDYIGEDTEDWTDEEIAELKAKTLKELDDHFGLDLDIEEEYSDYMWLVKSGKYNI